MATREKIIDKIKKLLALAGNNANEAECIAASLKAQKLISEYDVEDEEIYGIEPPQIYSLESPLWKGKIWRGYLATSIAQNFRCTCFMSSYKLDEIKKYASEHSVTFVGYTCDVQAAALVYEKCVEVGERLAKERFDYYKREYGSAYGVKNTFLEGFCAGVDKELSKQAQALMLITPKEVLDIIDNMELHTEEFDNRNAEFDDYHEGVEKGRDTIRSSRLDNPESDTLYQLELPIEIQE